MNWKEGLILVNAVLEDGHPGSREIIFIKWPHQ
jgi:hypothetical protein